MLGRGNESSKISLLAICRFMSDIMVRAEPPAIRRKSLNDWGGKVMVGFRYGVTVQLGGGWLFVPDSKSPF